MGIFIRGLRVVTTYWSWVWSNRISPSKWVGLGSPLAACSVYEDFTCSVHTVNNLCMFNCQCHFYLCNRGPYVRLAFVPNMLSSWNKDIIIVIIGNDLLSWGNDLLSWGNDVISWGNGLIKSKERHNILRERLIKLRQRHNKSRERHNTLRERLIKKTVNINVW